MHKEYQCSNLVSQDDVELAVMDRGGGGEECKGAIILFMGGELSMLIKMQIIFLKKPNPPLISNG